MLLFVDDGKVQLDAPAARYVGSLMDGLAPVVDPVYRG